MFVSIAVIDKYFHFLLENKKELESNKVQLLGVVSLMIGVKYNESLSLPIRIVEEKLSHGKYSREEILDKEKEILMSIGF